MLKKLRTDMTTKIKWKKGWMKERTLVIGNQLTGLHVNDTNGSYNL